MTSDQQGAPVPPSSGPGGPAGPRSGGGSRWPLVAVGAAGLALVLGLLATALSLRALDQANDARDIARAAGAGRPLAPTPGTGEPTDAPTTPAPEPTGAEQTPGTPQPSLNQQTRYTDKYVDQRLTLRAACDSSVDIDLDKPEVRVSDGEEIRFTARCGGNSSYFNLTRSTDGTQVDSASLGAADCNDRILTGAIGPDINVPARKGVAICVRTSLPDAQERGDTWKMALLHVTDVNDDGTVVVSVRAWDIPL